MVGPDVPRLLALIVIAAQGFKAVIIRSVIAALTSFTGAKDPTKTFDGVDALLEPDGVSGRAFTADDVRKAYDELVRLAASR